MKTAVTVEFFEAYRPIDGMVNGPQSEDLEPSNVFLKGQTLWIWILRDLKGTRGSRHVEMRFQLGGESISYYCNKLQIQFVGD